MPPRVHRPLLVLDNTLANADWTKTSWDLPATNLKELHAYLKTAGLTAAQFKKLPVYLHNVKKLPWLKKL